ncbi:MAG: monofunctional biosynthetic peptidoglycan transglycosylase [Candidatus Binatia bacterium]
MKRLLIKTVLIALAVGWIGYEYARLPDVSPLKTRNPKTTALIDMRDREYRQRGLKPVRRQHWAPYGAISEHLKKAVLLGEDAAFFSHRGVDLFELKEAAKDDWERKQFKRGASTITMQLAKNLYLNPSKNPLRKLREVVIAWQLENALSKRRIFEIYLNVAEWGVGIYGVEAAARRYFAKSASDLTPAEAATLAALLPSPRDPGERSLIKRRDTILTRMAKRGYISEEVLEGVRGSPPFSAEPIPSNDFYDSSGSL